MGKRVLIADDSSNTRTILRFMLQNQGFEIIEAENGEEVLAKASSYLPDIIVLDGMMPKKSGFVACRELKENPNTSVIPVILLTAVPQSDPTFDWSKESPADKCMSKPFRLNDLLEVIEVLLGSTSANVEALRRKETLDSAPGQLGIRKDKSGR